MASITSGRPEKFSIGRVFSNTFAVIGRSFGPLAVIVGLFSALPTFIYNLWNLTQLARIRQLESASTFESEDMARFAAASVIAGLVFLVLSFLAQAALVRLTVDNLNGRRPAVGDCIQVALRRFFPMLGIGFIVFVALVLAAVAMGVVASILAFGGLFIGWPIGVAVAFIPAAMWLISISVAIPVAVQERLGVLGSISRSRALTKGSRWPIFGLLLIIGIAAGLLQAAFSLLFRFALASASGLSGSGIIVGSVGSSLLSTVFSAVISVAIAVIYVELRQVKEGASIGELAEIFS
ncbi:MULTISPECIES: hypothetical protein [unclassified Mesorhizobium]|uniref:hypothetical protein n=1 Tax=unclassified Mesorhizobium TaxID=325217 RepID=UPI00112AE4C5|nr:MULTISPECIES: hypothetical protein [unclassified Mesorhizobium]TPK92948.1 hypothetical protein FJ567_27255 [Mesorhizobium sp. B2-4-16]TPL59489.1 hypothetical protein FJ956_28355 [Mesorhizobium sp. B2-4-3]